MLADQVTDLDLLTPCNVSVYDGDIVMCRVCIVRWSVVFVFLIISRKY